MANEDFDYGSLGPDCWSRIANEIGANEKQAKFAARKHAGASNSEAARDSGYGVGSDEAARTEGYRVFRSNKVQQMLALAAAEEGGTSKGDITEGEARQILSALARGSDPQIKIKALESLSKLDAAKSEAERLAAQNRSGDPRDTLRKIAERDLALAFHLSEVYGVDFDPPVKYDEHQCPTCGHVNYKVIEPNNRNAAGNGYVAAH